MKCLDFEEKEMLIRLLSKNILDDDPYENAKFLSAFIENRYGEFIRMLRELKNGKEEFQISVGENWYTIDTYIFSFPENSEMLPCINVYVYEN